MFSWVIFGLVWVNLVSTLSTLVNFSINTANVGECVVIYSDLQGQNIADDILVAPYLATFRMNHVLLLHCKLR